MEWVRPIYDRTSEDLEEFKKLKRMLLSRKWDDILLSDLEKYKTSKAVLNDFDLNRIEGNIEHINSILIDLDYTRDILHVKTDWNKYSFDNINVIAEFNRIRDNILYLLNRYDEIIISYIPENMIPLNYKKINAIEKSLYDIYEMIKHMIIPTRYAGEEFSFDRNF